MASSPETWRVGRPPPVVKAKGADHQYSDAGGEIGLCRPLAEQNALAPSWAFADTSIPGLMSSSFGFTGRRDGAVRRSTGVEELTVSGYGEVKSSAFKSGCVRSRSHRDERRRLAAYGGKYKLTGRIKEDR